MSVDIIGRLAGVKQTAADRWVARCPAHEDKRPSLSVRQCADGTWLLHDFGGCSALDVCHAIGVEFSDLFPDSKIRRIEDRRKPRIPAAERLELVDHEVRTAMIVINDILKAGAITDEQTQRLVQASSRIGAARYA